jgi:FkbM family methyltransferase
MPSSTFHRLAARVLGVLGLSFRSDLERARAKRNRTREQLERERQAYQAARKRVADLRTQAAKRQAALDSASAVVRRLTAIQQAVRSSLADRLANAAAREPQDALAASREADLIARSPEYAAACGEWRSGRIPPDTARVTIAGLRWAVPSDQGSALRSRIVDRAWLPIDDIVFVRQFTGRGVMLDVGANIGTTCIPRIVLGDFTHAYAAEPNAANYLCLVGNVLDNGLAGRVLPDCVAIANRSGTAALHRTSTIGGHQLLVSPREKPVDTVRCLTMDDWMERLGVEPADVAFIKVDTQGWDLHVLEGAARLLAHRRAVWQIEVSPSMMKHAGRSIEDLCAFTARHFQSVVAIDSTDSAPVRPAAEAAALVAAELGRRRFMNLLLLPASKM